MAKPKHILTKNEKKLIIALYESGKTDKQISDTLKIPRQSFRKITKYNNLSATIKKAKLTSDKKVEKSMYENACGYSCKEDKIFNNNGMPLIVPTIKHFQPDTTAGIFWLCNRQRGIWNNVNRIEHTGKDGIPLNLGIDTLKQSIIDYDKENKKPNE